jgi:ABC-type branched-subunit amino acid transport system ATPase component
MSGDVRDCQAGTEAARRTVLTGRVKPSRGRIRLDGEDIAGLSPHAIANKGVARSFQIMTLFDEFTARENVIDIVIRREPVKAHAVEASTMSCHHSWASACK